MIWRQFIRGARALVNRKRADQDIADELDHFLEEATAELIARGFTAESARRTAQLELGSVTAAREEVREYGWENLADSLLSDLRYAARRLAGTPGFTAVSILTLMLGIGATTAIFTVTECVLLKPLRYEHPEQLVTLMHTAPGINVKELGLAVSLYFTYVEENRVFQNVGIWTPDAWTVTGLSEPEQVRGLSVSHDFLSVLGVTPQLGRGFSAAEADPGGESTVILSDDYWRSRFGADRSISGRRLLVDGKASTVIGVLPRSFDFMDRKIAMLRPLRFRRAEVRLISFCCGGIARLKPGVTLDKRMPM